MPIFSMTGFARAEGERDGFDWTWEIKSVNGRGLDVRFRLPPGFDYLEPALRTAVAERLTRGNVSVALNLNIQPGAAAVQVNREILDSLLATAAELEGAPGTAPARLDGLLAVRGVIESREPDLSGAEQEARESDVLGSFGDAVQSLADIRGEEGARLAKVVEQDTADVADLAVRAAAATAAREDAFRQRLKERVQALLDEIPGLPEERLAQEVAAQLVKTDVAEELERLRAHVSAIGDLLGEGGAIGRRLDFLCQELNREANTLCAKANDVELGQIGLDLKAVIDRMREQVQNIE